MVQIGVFHNGGGNVPLKESEGGLLIPDASMSEVQEDNKQVLQDQVRHGILADEHGYDRITLTEHHFQPTAAEFSPNPLLAQMAMASRTEDIKLQQVANIITWHDPVRLAEQTAMLDVISGGRAEIGIGRGYQPRENEVLGDMYWGGTIQDQEKNRVVFEEKFEILKKAWTEELITYRGDHHSIPPKHTRWHHSQDYEYLRDPVSGHEVEDMIEWIEEEDEYASETNPVADGRSRLKSLFVTPQPLQEPFPQLWMPVTSERSIKWAARNGVNGYLTTGTLEILKQGIDLYHETAKEEGWPDRRPEYEGEPFRKGFDEARNRGVMMRRFVFLTDVHDEETFERWKAGVGSRWDFYGGFGFGGLLTESIESDEAVTDPITGHERPTVEALIEEDIAIAGTAEEVIDAIASMKEECGFEDFSFDANFETVSVTGEEADEQLEAFAEEVVPYLQEEFPSPEPAAADDD